MGRNVIRRIRWGNVALAAAGTVALVFGISWGFSATTAPVLPGDEPRPVLAQEPVPTPTPTPTPSPPPANSEKRDKEQRVKPRAPRRARRGKQARDGEARGKLARRGEARAAEAPGGEARGGETRGGEARGGETRGGGAGGGDAPAPVAVATPAPTVPPVRAVPRRRAPAPPPGGEFGFEG
jgi:hypothetical protein